MPEGDAGAGRGTETESVETKGEGLGAAPETELDGGAAPSTERDAAPRTETSDEALARHVSNVRILGALRENDKLWHTGDARLELHPMWAGAGIVRALARVGRGETLGLARASVRAVIAHVEPLYGYVPTIRDEAVRVVQARRAHYTALDNAKKGLARLREVYRSQDAAGIGCTAIDEISGEIDEFCTRSAGAEAELMMRPTFAAVARSGGGSSDGMEAGAVRAYTGGARGAGGADGEADAGADAAGGMKSKKRKGKK